LFLLPVLGKGKLRPQRHDIKELDFLFLGYVDSEYEIADTQEKAEFCKLLDLDHFQLIGILLGKLAVETAEMKALIKR
jgi:succinate dehydrogenase flavin-adding protein (antitoxin of CptAB toxin-antitoxin module)